MKNKNDKVIALYDNIDVMLQNVKYHLEQCKNNSIAKNELSDEEMLEINKKFFIGAKKISGLNVKSISLPSVICEDGVARSVETRKFRARLGTGDDIVKELLEELEMEMQHKGHKNVYFYICLIPTPIFIDQDFSPRKGILTRYISF